MYFRQFLSVIGYIVTRTRWSDTSRLGHVQAFPMYGGLGMSAPSLHRESTDSLIGLVYTVLTFVMIQFLPLSSSLYPLQLRTILMNFQHAFLHLYTP